MMTTTAKSENIGSSVPAVQSTGTQTADNYSESQFEKPCPHRYCGCISQNGYMCLHRGPCDPCDENGRRFTVSYIVVDGQRLMCRDFGKKKTLVLGVPNQIIDADAAIANTPFADAKPFDPAQFVNDRVAS